MEDYVAVPTPARAIPAYTRVTRDHLWDPKINRLAVVFLPPEAVTHEMLVKVPDVLGRVLNHEKLPGYVFTNADFMPAGTREGIVGGIPAGKRALRIPTDNVEGLFGLHAGDHFDLVATMPIAEGRSGNQGSASGASTRNNSRSRPSSNWRNRRRCRSSSERHDRQAMTTRQIPVAQSPPRAWRACGRCRKWCRDRSGRGRASDGSDGGASGDLDGASVGSPDEPVNSRTPTCGR
jgi:hypothetical protein